MTDGPGLVLFGLKTCDTCRKALRALEAAGRRPRLRDVRAEPLTDAERARLLAAFGPALINRTSTTWRALSESDRARPAAELLCDYPALMKRPVTDDGATLRLGWGPEVQAALLS